MVEVFVSVLIIWNGGFGVMVKGRVVSCFFRDVGGFILMEVRVIIVDLCFIV